MQPSYPVHPHADLEPGRRRKKEEGALSVFHLHLVGSTFKLVEFDLQSFEVVSTHRADAYTADDGMEIIQHWIDGCREEGRRVLFFIHTEIIMEPAVQSYLRSAKPYPFGFFEVAEGADWEAQFLADIPGFLAMVDRALEGPLDAAKSMAQIQKTVGRSERKVNDLVRRIGDWQKSTDKVMALQRRIVGVLHAGIGDLLAILEPTHPEAVRAARERINRGLLEVQNEIGVGPPR